MDEKKIGRPKTGTAKYGRIGVRLDKDQYDKLIKIASSKNISYSELVRNIIEEYLKNK